MNESQVSFLTIITRDYYWWAKTWAESVAEHHPNAKIHIAIADSPDAGHLDALKEFEVLCVADLSSQLGIDSYSRMAFQYTPFELTCSLKPFLMKYLQQKFSKVIYLDADTFVYRPFSETIDSLDDAEIVASPHLLQPIGVDQEATIRNAGTLNGGFVAVRRGPSSSRFLDWWSERCRYDCCVDPYAGKFVDQSWLDLAAQFFDTFRVIRDETINVAYWNLGSRKISHGEGRFLVNEQPLTFFHFSGLDPGQNKKLSRFDSVDIEGDLGRLVQRYQNRLIANRNEELTSIYCEYSCYRDGVAIDPVHREAIRSRVVEMADVENPFDTEATPDIRLRLESIREKLVLGRKHWQLEELQRLANKQTEWIHKQSQRRLDKKLVQACRRLYGMVKDRWFDPGRSRKVATGKHGEAA